MALDKQINLFKVDTYAFLSPEEKIERDRYIQEKEELTQLLKEEYPEEFKNIKEINNKSRKKETKNFLTEKEQKSLEIDKKIKESYKNWKEFLKKSSKNSVDFNKEHPCNKVIRELDERYLSYRDKVTGEKKVNLSNVISMFESTLSRSFKIGTNELTYDIFILEIYFYDIAQDLILNGFNYNGKHYVYFSSSAGQIRTKKAVFVEEEKYKSCKLKLMCGLTIDKINRQGGMNVNKFLAYLALCNSATDLWEDVLGYKFDIDKSIVVDDFETLVKCKVDNIDYETYEITPNVIQEMPIPHTDGCGMILPSCSKKNFMVRLPFIKGLLGSFDYLRFIEENNCSSVIKDIWGKEHDVIKEDIQVIFTKSQLKMYKYYSSWDEYKTYFKQYECEACICNMEEDRIPNAKINYQMLQTLYKATDEDIADICRIPNKKIMEVCDSLENALEFFGVYYDDCHNEQEEPFQKALKIYPELLTDPATKQDLKDLKNSLVKKYKGAKLDVTGKFTFVLPDLYAFCEWLFMDIKKPKGLIEDGEVFCRLYKRKDKLDCLRSPHLYIEHAIRKNVCSKKYRNQYLDTWFKTDAIYISTHDLISRILQLDVDGDRLLVLAQERIIKMAEEVMEGVNPLYYEMKKAKAEIITNESIYNGLLLAFTGGKIGGISNDITKIWNSEEINNEETKEEAMKAIRWLCMETNFTIDYAKTLFKPTRPLEVDSILKKYGKEKVPHFFYYAKDKIKNQVANINNSTINKIVKEIKENRTMFKPIKNLAPVNYLLLLKNKEDNYFNEELNRIFDRNNKQYGNNIKIDSNDTKKNNISVIALEVKRELNEIEPDDDKVINSLVKFLYEKPSSRKKKLLWYIYGEQIYENLLTNVEHQNICLQCGKRTEENLVNGKCLECRQEEIKRLKGKKRLKCIDCGEEFEINASNTAKVRCDKCQKEYRKLYKAQKERERKAKNGQVLFNKE